MVTVLQVDLRQCDLLCHLLVGGVCNRRASRINCLVPTPANTRQHTPRQFPNTGWQCLPTPFSSLRPRPFVAAGQPRLTYQPLLYHSERDRCSSVTVLWTAGWTVADSSSRTHVAGGCSQDANGLPTSELRSERVAPLTYLR
jgi:hypothetical protein